MKYDILHVYVFENYRMEHETIGSFDTEAEATAFAEKYINDRSSELHGPRLFEIFVIANEGDEPEHTIESYLDELYDCEYIDENNEVIDGRKGSDNE